MTDNQEIVAKSTVTVVDIFAGPGGLGEGFTSYVNETGVPCFKTALSIEKEDNAHRTLRLRAFFRQFEKDQIPLEYYKLLSNEISESELYLRYPQQAQLAENQAWQAELGVTNPGEVDSRIKQAICNSKNWILIGGPPCQAYSLIGRSRYSRVWKNYPNQREEDKRHFLYREYLRILAKHEPKFFVLENVKGLLSSEVSDGKIAEKIFKDLKDPVLAIKNKEYHKRYKYRLYSMVKEPRSTDLFGEPVFSPGDFIVRSEMYGIPQCRHRVIILGIRDDILLKPELMQKKEFRVPIKSVINDLPRIRSGISKEADSSQKWVNIIKRICNDSILNDDTVPKDVKQSILLNIDKLSQYLDKGDDYIPIKSATMPEKLGEWFTDKNLKGFCNHSARSHMPEDLARYFYCACYASVKGSSPKLEHFPKDLLPKHKNVQQVVNQTIFSDRFRVQLRDKPSTTVASHISKDGHYYIHPDPLQCRSLTVREAARIQTFPDNYYFLGPRTSQYQQVGNAVPPFLAFQIAGVVYNLLSQLK